MSERRSDGEAASGALILDRWPLTARGSAVRGKSLQPTVHSLI
jgi:hypothetical protein